MTYTYKNFYYSLYYYSCNYYLSYCLIYLLYNVYLFDIYNSQYLLIVSRYLANILHLVTCM